MHVKIHNDPHCAEAMAQAAKKLHILPHYAGKVIRWFLSVLFALPIFMCTFILKRDGGKLLYSPVDIEVHKNQVTLTHLSFNMTAQPVFFFQHGEYYVLDCARAFPPSCPLHPKE